MGAGLVLWDRAYETRRAARLTPPPPDVLARNLVEDVVGPKTVQNVAVDEKAGTLELSVTDVLIKPGQPRDEMRKNLASEGALAIQLLRSYMAQFTTVTIHLVKDKKVLATVRVTSGQKEPVTEFSPEVK